jgi:hypothetical protein
MALGSTARKPEGLQISFLEKRYDYAALGAAATNGMRTLMGTLPKGTNLLAIYTPRKEAPAGGARQIWLGTLSDKTALVNTAGFTEGTAHTAITAFKNVNFTQDTDIYFTQTSMTTTKPTAGVVDFTIAYAISAQFGVAP